MLRIHYLWLAPMMHFHSFRLKAIPLITVSFQVTLLLTLTIVSWVCGSSPRNSGFFERWEPVFTILIFHTVSCTAHNAWCNEQQALSRTMRWWAPALTSWVLQISAHMHDWLLKIRQQKETDWLFTVKTRNRDKTRDTLNYHITTKWSPTLQVISPGRCES